MIYLAAPYNDKCSLIIQSRMEAVYEAMAEYTKRGEYIITPLVMHEVVTRHGIDGTFEFWRGYCFDLLIKCDKMVVLMLDGWTNSSGVASEIEFCNLNNIPVEYKLSKEMEYDYFEIVWFNELSEDIKREIHGMFALNVVSELKSLCREEFNRRNQ